MPPQTISGAYSATYNAKAVGITETGYRISHELFKQIITGDTTGQTPVNAIYQGRAQFVMFTAIEAGADAIVDLVNPYSNGVEGILGTVGQQDVSTVTGGVGVCAGAAKPLILTAIPGLCAESRGPQTITFPLAVLAENYPVDVLHGPNNKMVPIRLRVYPNDAGQFYTVT